MLSEGEATEITGITNQQVSRWAKLLKDQDAYRWRKRLSEVLQVMGKYSC
jgi:hypothetical protein